MHQLFATVLSLLLAFCHHLGHTVLPVQAANRPDHASVTSPDLTGPAVILPDRYQFARTAGTYR